MNKGKRIAMLYNCYLNLLLERDIKDEGCQEYPSEIQYNQDSTIRQKIIVWIFIFDY